MKCSECLYWWTAEGENLPHCHCPLDTISPCDVEEEPVEFYDWFDNDYIPD